MMRNPAGKNTHKHINVAKNSLSVSDFVTMCREVVTHADAIQSLR